MLKHKRILVIGLFLLLVPVIISAEELVHVVAQGETVYGISRKYSVSPDSLMRYNDISDPSRIKVGQKIRIPDTYTIQKGDTLYGIARSLNVPFDELLSANGLTRDSKIQTDDTLYIPRSAQPAVVTKTTEPVKTVSPVLEDPRVFESRTVNTSVIWPIQPLEISWLTGKVHGVALTGKNGEKVKSIASGSVVSTGPYRGFGQVLFVQAKSGYIYVYGGLEGNLPSPGTAVSFGDELGILSIDLLSGKPRLYFMVYNKDIPVDPVKAPRGY